MNFIKLSDKYPYKISFLLGLLFTLAFSPFYFLPISLVFLFLLRRIDKSDGLKEAFISGFLFYFAHNLTLIPWVMNVSKFVGPLLFPGYILASFGVALYYGVASLITKKIGLKYSPLVFVFIEFLRQFGVLKFPWELSGYMFGFNNYFIQSVDIFGVFGLSFLFYIIVLFIYYGMKYKNKLFYNLATVVVVINFIYGYSTYNTNRDAISTMNIGVLQSNISQDIKWEKGFKDSTYIIYNNLINSVKSDSTDLIVWAETAVPAWLERSHYDLNRVSKIVKNSGTYNYLGSLRYQKDKREKIGYKYYNSMFLFDKEGKIRSHYDKSVLVQFGEYVPFGNAFPFLKTLDFGNSNFSFGKNKKLLTVGNASIATSICFEIIFPNYVREEVSKGANLIITTSNDAWFEFMEPQQHFEMSRFRAIENRRYLVRSGNIGISAIVAENGKIIKKLGVKNRGAIIGKVKLLGDRTFYNKYGDLIVYLSIFGIFLRFFVVIKNNRKRREQG